MPGVMIAHMGVTDEIHILLIEDNPGDVRLFREAMKECTAPCSIQVARDGEEAKNMLFARRTGSDSLPDLIVLDLNLPKVTGDQILLLLKADNELRDIPVLILSSSSDPSEIRRCYENHAACYLVKPSDLGDYMRLVQAWGNFWMSLATLPPRRPTLRARA